MDYKLKYLKYKQKYLKLKNIFGGDRIDDLILKINAPPKFNSFCDPYGYKQFQNECWNDSLLTPICFSDDIKDIVQLKLNKLSGNEIIELAFLSGRDYMMYPNYFIIKKLYNNFPEYLNTIKKRFNRLILTPKIENRKKDTDSSICSVHGLSMLTTDRVKVLGGTHFDITLLIKMLSFALLDNDTYINYTYHFLKYDHDFSKPIDDINPFAVVINLDFKDESGHVVSFIKCGGKYNLYDNNSGLKEFRWDIYLQKIYKENYVPIIYTLAEIKFGLFKDSKMYILNNDTLIEKSDIVISKKISINNFIFLSKKNGRDNFLNDSKEFFTYLSIINNDIDTFVGYIDSGYINKDTIFADNNNLYHLLAYTNCSNPEFYNCVKLIGTNINHQNLEKFTPINYAIVYENINSMKLLLNGSNLDITDNQYNTPLYNAIDVINKDMVRILLNAGANPNKPGNNNTSPFHLAIFKKDFDIYDTIFKKGIDLEIKDNEGRTVLLDVCINIKDDLEFIDLANYLIDNGANLYVKTSKNSNLLHLLVLLFNDSKNLKVYQNRFLFNLLERVYNKIKDCKDDKNNDGKKPIDYNKLPIVVALFST